MLEGLAEVARSLEALGIRFVLRTERPDRGVLALAKDAAVVVVDRGYLRLQRLWYRDVAEAVPVPARPGRGRRDGPGGDGIAERGVFGSHVPPEGRPPPGAVPAYRRDGAVRSGPRSPSTFPRSPVRPSTRSSPGSPSTARFPRRAGFTGGTAEANRRFGRFLQDRLDGFADDRNDPGGDGGSEMSPYLHYGQVSPVTLAVLAREHGGSGTPAFLEELVVRRELAVNFVRYNDALRYVLVPPGLGADDAGASPGRSAGVRRIRSTNSSGREPTTRTGTPPSRR